jgi:hypothetical protein
MRKFKKWAKILAMPIIAALMVTYVVACGDDTSGSSTPPEDSASRQSCEAAGGEYAYGFDASDYCFYPHHGTTGGG